MNYYEDEYGNVYTEKEWQNKNMGEAVGYFLLIVFILLFRWIKWSIGKTKLAWEKMLDKNADCLVDYTLGLLPFYILLHGFTTAAVNTFNGKAGIFFVLLTFLLVNAYNILFFAMIIWVFFVKDKLSEHVWIKPLNFYVNKNGLLMCEALRADDGKKVYVRTGKKLERKFKKRKMDFWVRTKIYKGDMYGSYRTLSENKIDKIKIDENKELVIPKNNNFKFGTLFRKITAMIGVIFVLSTYFTFSTVGAVINNIYNQLPVEQKIVFGESTDPVEVANVISPYLNNISVSDLINYDNFVTGFGIDATPDLISSILFGAMVIFIISIVIWQLAPLELSLIAGEIMFIVNILNGTSANLGYLFAFLPYGGLAILVVFIGDFIFKKIYNHIYLNKILKLYIVKNEL